MAQRGKFIWKKLDPQILQALMSPTARGRRMAMEKIAWAHQMSLPRLYERCKHLGVYYLEARMGPDAAGVWLNHVKSAIKFYRGSRLLLHSLAVDHYRKIVSEQKAFLEQSFDETRAARLLNVQRASVRFWADVLGALTRDQMGRFSGHELRRFWEQDKHLLVAIRIAQHRKVNQ